MSKSRKQAHTEDTSWQLESTLEPGMLRFLAHVLENGLQAGLRTEEDFIRHFPPAEIMKGLSERPDLRANILVPTTGVRPKIALKKSAESAGLDLQIALDEGETDASVIVSLFHPDDRVRYLDKARLWDYISEPKFWKVEKGRGAEFERAKTHVSYILDRAMEEKLVTQHDIVDGISVGTLVRHLPANEVQAVIEKALSNSRENKPFTEHDLLKVTPMKTLVEYVPLAAFWESVICQRVANREDVAGGSAKRDESWRMSTVEQTVQDAEMQNGAGYMEDRQIELATVENGNLDSGEY